MRRVIGLLFCVLFLQVANNAFALSWRSDKITFSSYDRDPESFAMIKSYYIMNADGSDVTRLLEEVFQYEGKKLMVNDRFSLSPDCKKVAIQMRELGGNRMDIATLEIESHRIVNLTGGESKLKACGGPRWSPDGVQIVFEGSGELSKKLYIMNSNGSNIEVIGEGTGADWSPDGRRIAFIKDRTDIYTMHTDGGNVKKIAQSPVEVGLLRWSPNGKQLLISTYTNDGDNHIYIVDSDGGDLELIRESALDACWSPDGKKIAFTAVIGPEDEANFWHGTHIWVINPDGTGLKRLTDNDRGEAEFDWRDPSFFGVSLSPNAAKTTWGAVKTRR